MHHQLRENTYTILFVLLSTSIVIAITSWTLLGFGTSSDSFICHCDNCFLIKKKGDSVTYPQVCHNVFKNDMSQDSWLCYNMTSIHSYNDGPSYCEDVTSSVDTLILSTVIPGSICSLFLCVMVVALCSKNSSRQGYITIGI